MRTYALLLFTAFQLLGCQAQKSTDALSIDKKEIQKKADKLIQEYLALDIFSGVALIAQGGQPFYHKAFGVANRKGNVANDVNTTFNIGSMNKTFTRVVVLQLIQEEQLRFSDKLVDLLDGFEQDHVEKITLQQLLNHTSGFGDYLNPSFFDIPYAQKTIQGILPLVKKMDLLFEPGTSDEYSNAGYIILGAIIEKVTGKPYAQNVQERIATPLELKSLVTKDIQKTQNRAFGYLKTIDGYEDNEAFIHEPCSDGGFYANTQDILRFYRAFLYEDTLISQAVRSKDDFLQRIAPIYEKHGAGIPFAGGFNGANTIHIEMLADDISILVFANMDEPVAEKIAIGLLHCIKGKTPEKPSLPATINLYSAYKEKGTDFIRQNFDTLTQNWFANDPKDLILNYLGYELMSKEQFEDALQLLKLNTELFPEVSNTWDSYAEVLLKTGEKKAALEAYQKALEIDPKLTSTREMVEKLKENQ